MIYDILPVNNYRGNNNSTKFDFDFYVENESQLKVYLFDENNVKTELKYNIDYSINDFKNKLGGYIVFPLKTSKLGVLGDKQKISLELSLPISQDAEYNKSSLLDLDALEYSLDYLTRLIQILSRKISLCVKVEECSEITPDELIDDTYKSLSDVLSKVDNAKKLVDEVKDTANKANDLANEVFRLNPANADFSNINDEAVEVIKSNAQTEFILEELKKKLDKKASALASMPDYSAAVEVSLPYSPPCSGMLYVIGVTTAYSQFSIFVNGLQCWAYKNQSNLGDQSGRAAGWVFANKGDVVSGNATAAGFVPLKGELDND